MGQISASLMCVDLMNVERSIRVLEKAGIDYLHIDIMDWHFVPNITLSPDFVRALRKVTSLPLDIHLMTMKPEAMVPLLAPLSAEDIITVHPESTPHIHRVVDLIRKTGARAGAAINPGTPICVLEDLFPYLDIVLLMTVNPGFAGQSLVESTLDKIRRLRDLLDGSGHSATQVMVDGNVSFDNAVKMRGKGADIFVAGSSSLFAPGASLDENCARLRSCIA
jgi:ribulose-phosphate 3-epimerase